MKAILISLVVFVTFSPRLSEGQTVSPPEKTYVSVLQLIANPERFDGQLISVVGFLAMGRERDLLLVHQEDAIHIILSNGILVDRTEQMGKDKNTLNKKYVQIVGVFRAGGKHTVPFVGTITGINKCRLWSDPDLPISKRLKEIPGVASEEP